VPKTSPKLIFLLKACVGVLLLAFVLYRADWNGVVLVLREISLIWIALLLLLSIVMIWLSCVKWRLFLSARGSEVPVRALMKLYLIGYFFNNFAPSNVGGDVARGMLLGKRIQNKSDSFGTVFLERFTGLVALIGMALAATLLRPDLLQNTALTLLLAGMGAGFAVMMLLLISRRAQTLALRIFDRLPFKKLTAKLRKFVEVVFYFRAHRRVLLQAMLLSVSFHLITVINTQAACLALGLQADFLTLAVVVPLVLIIAIIPVSVNALGIMEGAFVFFLAYAGLDAAEALSVALVLRVKAFLLAAAGGVLFLLRPRDLPAEAVEAPCLDY